MPKVGCFGSKSLNFLILIQSFYIYLYSTMVISIITFEQTFANVGIMGQKQSVHLEEILLRY